MQANSQKRRARKTALEFAGYVAPAVFFITLFVGIPFVMCIYYSFRKWNGIGKTSEFVGLENCSWMEVCSSVFLLISF